MECTISEYMGYTAVKATCRVCLALTFANL